MTDNGTTTQTFYGAKASRGANNPCKGATTRPCGKIVTEYVSVSTTASATLYKTESKIMDVDGVLLNTTYEQVTVPSSMSFEEFYVELKDWSNTTPGEYPGMEFTKD